MKNESSSIEWVVTFDSGLARTVRVEPSKKPYDFFQGEYEVAGEKRYSYGNSPASACCAAFEYVAEGPSFDAQRIVSVRRADAFSRDLIPSACVLLEQDGLFAVVFSAKHGGAPEVPGGKADSPTETRDETAARELWEEVGVRATELWPLITVDTRTPSTGAIHPCTAFALRRRAWWGGFRAKICWSAAPTARCWERSSAPTTPTARDSIER
jgi:ADP-ribose pyrophosphatase YjhB (NUDIX family)